MIRSITTGRTLDEQLKTVVVADLDEVLRCYTKKIPQAENLSFLSYGPRNYASVDRVSLAVVENSHSLL